MAIAIDCPYDLMEAAYDARQIYAVSSSLGHIPIIDKNDQGRESIPLAPHEAARHKEPTVAERFNGRLEEEFGGDNVMVRRARKSGLHLMFGVIALFADQLLKLSSYAPEGDGVLLQVVENRCPKVNKNRRFYSQIAAISSSY